MTDLVEFHATFLPIDDCAATISCGRDGTWLHLSASNGKAASINMDALSHKQLGVIAAAIRGWCADRQKQADEIRADNGQFGVGA